MKMPFRPLPEGEPPLDTKQFLFRLKHDPGFADTMKAHYESALALPLNDDTAELHQKAAAALRTLRHHQGLWNAASLMTRFITLTADSTDIYDPGILHELRTLANEATDHALDVLEPDRTRIMARIATVREMIRKIAEKE